MPVPLAARILAAPPPSASTDSLSVFLTSYCSCPPPTFRSAPPRPRALAPSTTVLSSARLSFHLSFSASFSRGWLYTRYRLSAVLRWLYRVSCLTTLIQFPRFPKCFSRCSPPATPLQRRPFVPRSSLFVRASRAPYPARSSFLAMAL